MKLRSTKPTSAGVDLVPLLDVVFSILAVFVLQSANLVAPRRLGVELPPRSSAEVVSPPEMLVLVLTATGELTLDDRPLTTDLTPTLQAFLARSPQGLVVLNVADETVPYKKALEQVQVLRAIAGDRVALGLDRLPEDDVA
ncbi:MAG: biopolymer transporter ExbD [Oscillatoriales cyanobacterium SM2_1_8]|nr:biopolymer transporter ExbD [Oscillatoriales cyanobacterium SM2_1_8]